MHVDVSFVAVGDKVADRLQLDSHIVEIAGYLMGMWILSDGLKNLFKLRNLTRGIAVSTVDA